MDKAQALAEPYLKIGRIVSRLKRSFESSEANVASVLLRRVELHKLGLFCQTFIQEDPEQQFGIDLPEFTAKHFLGLVANGKADLKVLSHEIKLTLGAEGSDGEWEMLGPDGWAAFGGERYTASIPFTEFRAPRSKLEERLKSVGIPIPEWFDLTRQCLFYRDHEGQWRIGEEIYSHMLGFTYIWALLRDPGEIFRAWDLYDDNLKPNPDVLLFGDQANEHDETINLEEGDEPALTSIDGYGAINDNQITGKDRKKYLTRLRVIEPQIEELEESGERSVDEDRVLGELTEERDWLRWILRRATDIHGKPRKLTPTKADKNTDSVRQAIGRAIKKIREKQPELAAYLDAYLKSGTEPVYTPPDDALEFVLVPPEEQELSAAG